MPLITVDNIWKSVFEEEWGTERCNTQLPGNNTHFREAFHVFKHYMKMKYKYNFKTVSEKLFMCLNII